MTRHFITIWIILFDWLTVWPNCDILSCYKSLWCNDGISENKLSWFIVLNINLLMQCKYTIKIRWILKNILTRGHMATLRMVIASRIIKQKMLKMTRHSIFFNIWSNKLKLLEKYIRLLHATSIFYVYKIYNKSFTV